MASVAVRCPQCGSDEVIKRGKTDTGGQRYRCRNAVCAQGRFLLEYRYQGYLPRVKRQIVDMALNGSGIRHTARGLGISKDTVVSELKKQTNGGFKVRSEHHLCSGSRRGGCRGNDGS